MHENKLTDNGLKNFISKRQQSIEQFVQSFDYINDSDIATKSQGFLKNQSHRKGNKVAPLAITSEESPKKVILDIGDQIEDIDLGELKSNVNGFWKGNNPVLTKFDNFLTDDELGILPIQNELYEAEPIENNRNRSNSFDLDSMFSNLEYVPSLIKSEKKVDADIIENTEYKSEDDAKLLQKISELNEEDNSEISKLDENQATSFPGEILECEDELETYEVVCNFTKLDTRTENKAEEIAEGSKLTSDDTVENFQLDSDHDYDLHINKPRFNYNPN